MRQVKVKPGNQKESKVQRKAPKSKNAKTLGALENQKHDRSARKGKAKTHREHAYTQRTDKSKGEDTDLNTHGRPGWEAPGNTSRQEIKRDPEMTTQENSLEIQNYNRKYHDDR